MRKNTLLTCLITCLTTLSVSAQQWISKDYSYDSLLNVTYGNAINFNGGTDTLKMDIYTPICDDSLMISRRPLMMIIHGGAFLAGDKSDVSITNMCKQFAKRGYVTASISYRLGMISDDNQWSCNYPNYSCVFATDSAEWYRALYRGIQDGKGALRYLINRNQTYRIDTNNVFVVGESAGALISLGIAFLDTITEKYPQAYAITNAPNPHSSTLSCQHNVGKTFTNPSIARPDLGSIDGTIEPSTVKYQIKGIGNMYGAMMSNLLKESKSNATKPAIFSFHQPCDLVVPFDSGKVFKGLSWCMTNGYNCYAISNVPKLYGSKTISDWNTNFSYGYNIHDEFTSTTFPYNFLFGAGSCTDQINNPCHAYDNATLRQNNMANFFASLITTNPICIANYTPNSIDSKLISNSISLYPNPFTNQINIELDNFVNAQVNIVNLYGQNIYSGNISQGKNTLLLPGSLAKGVYYIKVSINEYTITKMVIKSN